MRDRVRLSRFPLSRQERETETRQGRRSSRQLAMEVLEDRRLLASLQPISNLTVPSLQGYAQPLAGADGFTDPQTFTVTSSNPDIVASIAQGPFWTVNVSYTDPTNPSNNFSGPMTFQLFQATVQNGKTRPPGPRYRRSHRAIYQRRLLHLADTTAMRRPPSCSTASPI